MKYSICLTAILALGCGSRPPDLPPASSQVTAQVAAKSGEVETKRNTGGKWKVQSGESSFDDSKTVVLFLEAEGTINGWPSQTERPALILRCQEGKTDAAIITGMTGKLAFGEYGQDKGTVMRMRYDKGQTFEYEMAGSENKKAYFFAGPIDEIKYMLKSDSSVVEFTPFQSNTQEFRFDLRGLSDVIGDIRKTCSW